MNFTLNTFCAAISRKKLLQDLDLTSLQRVLRLSDLIAYGIGTTLGLGAYVLPGIIGRHIAGPAMIISFVIASIAVLLSCFCFAEFAVRVPRSGSVYIYSYVCIGELLAFNVGLLLLLQYMTASAAVATGMSMYIDELTENKISKPLTKLFPIELDGFQKYANFLASGLVIVVNIILAVGVSQSKIINNICISINLITLITVIVSGLFAADINNWTIDANCISENVTEAGQGGFFPFGATGVVIGAAQSFFGFIGFDCIATLSEEAVNPSAIPPAMIISLFIIALVYVLMGSVLTLAQPYYTLSTTAPYLLMFDNLGWMVIKMVVTVGALFALTSSLIGASMVVPRILCAMSSDGLIFIQISIINSKTGTAAIAIVISATISSIMALQFNLQHLGNLISLVSLLISTLISICVVVLRYKDSSGPADIANITFDDIIKQLFNRNKLTEPSSLSSWIVQVTIITYTVSVTILCIFLRTVAKETFLWIWIGILVCSTICVFFLMLIIWMQPMKEVDLPFKAPAVPLVPCLGIVVNIALATRLDPITWVELLIWLMLGNIIYFAYGILHSTSRIPVSS